jgi:hypothetical protein
MAYVLVLVLVGEVIVVRLEAPNRKSLTEEEGREAELLKLHSLEAL